MVLLQGQFQLVSLTASPFMDVARGSIALTVSIAQTDGVVIGGRVTGPMIAGSPMQVRFLFLLIKTLHFDLYRHCCLKAML